MTKIIAVVQARMSSSRLPGKVLKPLGGRTVVGQVFWQLSFARRISKSIVATSSDPSDDPLAAWAAENGVECARGSLADVLDRYYQAAAPHKPDAVARVTADCPLIDPRVADAVAERFASEGVDYCSNVNPPTYPDGLDVEIIRFSALERSWREATLPSEREHVTPYVRNHPELFRAANVERSPSWEHLRWTLDTADDYEFLRAVFERLESANGGANGSANDFIRSEDVVALLERESDLARLNAHLKRNEGYAKSLGEDKEI